MAFGIFGSDQDPYRRMQLMMAMSGMASGMQQPRQAGWSAPFGGAARGLAQMMPYLAQAQSQRYDQQQQQQTLQQLQQSLQGLPNQAGNPYGPIIQQLAKTPGGAEEALKLIGPMAAYQPAEVKLKPIWDNATKSMKYVPESQAVNQPSDMPLSAQEELKRAGAQNISIKSGPDFQVGQIPEGYVLRKDEKGGVYLEKLAGSPAEQAAQTQKARAEQAAGIIHTKVQEAKEIMSSADLPTTGMAGQWLNRVGGTAANDLRTTIDTIKSNVGLDTLQKLRQASPTGGGLGQISDRENEILQSAVASLDQSQSRDQFIKNLNQVDTIYGKIINGDPDKKLNAGPQTKKAAPGAAGGDIDTILAKPPKNLTDDPMFGGAAANPYADKSDQEILDELRKQGVIP
jgi:hypothetical protein